MTFFQEWQEALGIRPMAEWDWNSFEWGMLAGSVITVVVGGVVLYFGWPYITTGAKITSLIDEFKKAIGVD